MGMGDINQHIEAVGHRVAAKGMENQLRLLFASAEDPVKKKVRFRVGIHVYWSIIHVWLVSQQIDRAEVKMSLLLAQHGEVATGYACTKPKQHAYWIEL